MHGLMGVFLVHVHGVWRLRHNNRTAGHADSLSMCMSLSDNRTESAGASDNKGIKVFTINNKVSAITQG